LESLNGFAVFVQVAETRSFVAAGRLLGVSASAVGKSIARLEGRVGVRLFHRSTRSVALTPEGALLLERSRRILAEIEAAGQELSQARGEPQGRLRISLPMAGTLFLPILSDFMQAYPAIELDLDFNEQMVDVIEDGFDAVIRTGAPSDSRLAARTLGTFGFVLVASPDYLARHGTPATPEDLLQHTCLHYRYAYSGKLEQWALQRAPGAPELQLPISMICNSVETRVCFAQRGRGIAFLPEFAVTDALASGQLVSVLPGYIVQRRAFYVLWPVSKHPSPKVRALIDHLCQALSYMAPA
jgi:DNA-binding transcriptional LysR family regulator